MFFLKALLTFCTSAGGATVAVDDARRAATSFSGSAPAALIVLAVDMLLTAPLDAALADVVVAADFVAAVPAHGPCTHNWWSRTSAIARDGDSSKCCRMLYLTTASLSLEFIVRLPHESLDFVIKANEELQENQADAAQTFAGGADALLATATAGKASADDSAGAGGLAAGGLAAEAFTAPQALLAGAAACTPSPWQLELSCTRRWLAEYEGSQLQW